MPKEPVKAKVDDFREAIFGSAVHSPSSVRPRKSSCSLYVIAIILILIFCLALAGLFFIKKNGLKNTFDKITSSQPDLKLNSQTIKTDGVVRIRVTDEDLNKGIESTGDNFPLKKATAKINSQNITITGKTSDGMFSLTVTVTVLPKIKNGSVDFEIQSVKSLGVQAPKVATDSVNAQLSKFIAGYLPETKGIDVQKISLYDGFLEISGTEK